MPKQWLNVFFEENSQTVASMYELTSEEREAAFEEWAEEMFEIDLIVYHNGEKVILEGRNSALASLQKLCLKRVLERTGVRDRSRELALAQTGVN